MHEVGKRQVVGEHFIEEEGSLFEHRSFQDVIVLRVERPVGQRRIDSPQAEPLTRKVLVERLGLWISQQSFDLPRRIASSCS